jgi:hypothetical protein
MNSYREELEKLLDNPPQDVNGYPSGTAYLMGIGDALKLLDNMPERESKVICAKAKECHSIRCLHKRPHKGKADCSEGDGCAEFEDLTPCQPVEQKKK